MCFDREWCTGLHAQDHALVLSMKDYSGEEGWVHILETNE
jgi:hypothetical protein